MKNLAKLAATVAALTISAAANAAITVNINEVGSDVVASATGSFDLTGLIGDPSFFIEVGLRASPGYVGVGSPDFADVTGYGGFSGPLDWGTDFTFYTADSSAGDLFAFNAGTLLAFFSPDYVSGASLSGSATYLGETIASLGLTAGTYTYAGVNDTITIVIGGSGGVVPEPATWAMMIGGFGAAGGALRRRRKTVSLRHA